MSRPSDNILTYEMISSLIDYDPDTGTFRWRHRPESFFKTRQYAASWNTRYAGKEAFHLCAHTGYMLGNILDISVRAHRVAWLLYYKAWPANVIDHVNGVRDDNRISNLRDVTKQDNNKNRRVSPKNTSGATGVAKYKGNKWQAYINVGGKNKALGKFSSFEEALKARHEAEQEYGYHPHHGRNAVETVEVWLSGAAKDIFISMRDNKIKVQDLRGRIPTRKYEFATADAAFAAIWGLRNDLRLEAENDDE